MTTTTNTNPSGYFKCNFSNRKFAIPPQPKPPKKPSKKTAVVDNSSLNLKYEHKYAKLLFDMRKHIDRHREERSNHKIPRTLIFNLFTKVVGEDQQGKGRGGRPKGRGIARRKKGGPGDGSFDDDAASPAAAPIPTTRPKPR